MSKRKKSSCDGGPVVEDQARDHSGKRPSKKRDDKVPFTLNLFTFFLGFLLGLLFAYIAIKILTQFL